MPTANKPRPGGRPRTTLSEDVLLRALHAGAEYEAIARANECSERTVRRRVAECREKHGKAWGKPLKAPEPAPEAQAKPLPSRAPAWAELTSKARALFDEVLEGRQPVTKLLPHQITVAKAIIASPPPTETQAEPSDHADLLARLERAVGAPGKARD